MKAKFNTERKELVKAIAEITESKPKYLGAPTFAYEIAEFRVNKDGTVESEEEYDLKILIEALAFKGILSDEAERQDALMRNLMFEDFMKEEPTPESENPHEREEEEGTCLWIPKETLTETAIENLKKITESKKELFRRAFGESNIEILDEEDKIGFPWFPIPKDGNEMKAYAKFCELLCEMALAQKRVSAKEKPIENEKYEFRCFLLRLGFIGKEYKEERKVLLGNLEGSSAFKRGSKA